MNWWAKRPKPLWIYQDCTSVCEGGRWEWASVSLPCVSSVCLSLFVYVCSAWLPDFPLPVLNELITLIYATRLSSIKSNSSINPARWFRLPSRLGLGNCAFLLAALANFGSPGAQGTSLLHSRIQPQRLSLISNKPRSAKKSIWPHQTTAQLPCCTLTSTTTPFAIKTSFEQDLCFYSKNERLTNE